MDKFKFTDSIGDKYEICIFPENHSMYVSSASRFNVTPGRTYNIYGFSSDNLIYFNKIIIDYHDIKNIEYQLDSVELVEFIKKILKNKAFW